VRAENAVDPASEEEMEHAERQAHQGVHDKIWQRGILSYSVPDGREPLMGAHTEALCPTADSSSSSDEDEASSATTAADSLLWQDIVVI